MAKLVASYYQEKQIIFIPIEKETKYKFKISVIKGMKGKMIFRSSFEVQLIALDVSVNVR